MIRPLFLLLLFGIGFSTFAQDAVPVLTLGEAVSLAQVNNRLVKNAQLSVSMSGDQIAEARTYRFPSLNLYALGSQLLTSVDFTFQKGIFGEFPGIGPVPAAEKHIRTPLRPTFYGLTQLTQPLSQQYKIGLKIRQTRLARLVVEQKLRLEKQLVANQVKLAYYAIQQTQSALVSSEENLKFDRELDRLVEQYVKEQTALKGESMEAKAKIAQEEYNNLTLRDQLASQKEQLNELLGRDIRVDFAVTEIPEPTSFETNLEAAQAQALSTRPELREARLAVEQAEVNRRITKTQYIPDVSLAFSNLSLVNINFLPSNVASAGVLVTWDPVDWGRRKHELAEASKAIEQSKNSAHETEAQILVEVGAKLRKLRQARALLTATVLLSDAEQEKLRVVMNQFSQKASLLKDVLEQKKALENAVNQQNQALASFWTAKADFEKSVGEE